MPISPMVRITRISFQTDMTRADAPVIPVARLLESVWPDALRWVGLIGRTRFTPLELERINLETWPEFGTPHELLSTLWDSGWQASWGESGAELQRRWNRSALTADIEILPGLLPETDDSDPDSILAQTDHLLLARIMAEGKHLIPSLIAPVVQLQPKAPAQPTAAKWETDMAVAA